MAITFSHGTSGAEQADAPGLTFSRHTNRPRMRTNPRSRGAWEAVSRRQPLELRNEWEGEFFCEQGGKMMDGMASRGLQEKKDPLPLGAGPPMVNEPGLLLCTSSDACWKP